MPIYGEFARIYAGGDYLEFSRKMGEYLPASLEALEARPGNILDLACGEGTFALKAAELGFRVTGLDISETMLGFARDRIRAAGADVDFVRADMRAMPFAGGFDLVTCWFDSLNYILDSDDLRAVFHGIAGALDEGGLLIFDMNTAYGLAVNWRENPCYVRQDSAGVFEVHRQDYDFETGLAYMHITGFIKSGSTWRRIDEEHRERAYGQQEIHSYLRAAGFQVLASWGSFRDRSEPTGESPRVWYIAKRGDSAARGRETS
jgi:SAM-dependent methyltransferase